MKNPTGTAHVFWSCGTCCFVCLLGGVRVQSSARLSLKAFILSLYCLSQIKHVVWRHRKSGTERNWSLPQHSLQRPGCSLASVRDVHIDNDVLITHGPCLQLCSALSQTCTTFAPKSDNNFHQKDDQYLHLWPSTDLVWGGHSVIMEGVLLKLESFASLWCAYSTPVHCTMLMRMPLCMLSRLLSVFLFFFPVVLHLTVRPFLCGSLGGCLSITHTIFS